MVSSSLESVKPFLQRLLDVLFEFVVVVREIEPVFNLLYMRLAGSRGYELCSE